MIYVRNVTQSRHNRSVQSAIRFGPKTQPRIYDFLYFSRLVTSGGTRGDRMTTNDYVLMGIESNACSNRAQSQMLHLRSQLIFGDATGHLRLT